jgi:plastocyanin
MRFLGNAVVMGAAVLLAACGGGADTAAEGTDAAPAMEAPAAETPAMDAAAGAAQAVTGTVHEVKMLVNADQAYVYEPAEITIKQGDGIKFTMVSGGPHNVAFDGTAHRQHAEPGHRAHGSDDAGRG